MKLRPLILAALALCFLAVLSCGALLLFVQRQRSVPLESVTGGKPPAPLPKDAVVLSASDGAEVEAPFLLHDEIGAVGGIAAFLPKGSRTEEHKGKVRFIANVAEAGTYHAFVHAKWRDTCSNSASLKANQNPEFLFGNDDVFSIWHWVPAGKHALAKGKNDVTIVEREDGIYLDQVLLTQDAAYIPTGAIGTAGVSRDIRRFADTFTRSPGHGNEGWEFEGKGKFEVAFTFDPNRIPNQYALTGDASNGPACAIVKGTPVYGCKSSFSFMPSSDGKYGCILDKNGAADFLKIIFELKSGVAKVDLSSGGFSYREPLAGRLRLNQWHRVVVEHWAWITKVWLDEKLVLSNFTQYTKPGKTGLFVDAGTAVFDDLELEEIPWQADDGADLKIDWTQAEGAKWFRTDFKSGRRMSGQAGAIKAGLGGIPLEEIVLDESGLESDDGADKKNLANCSVLAPGLVESKLDNKFRTFRLPPLADGSCTHASFTAENPASGFRRVALRFGRRTPLVVNVGPYTFAESEMEDPSDYLDFTEEEYKAMARSPEAAKLKRHAKFKPVIGHGGGDEESSWVYMGGNWSVNEREGCLSGRGANARLRHAQEISSDMEMRFKVRLSDPKALGEIELYSGAEPGIRVQFSHKPPEKIAAGVALHLSVAADNQWHEVTLRVDGPKITAKLDRQALQETPIVRGDGDRIYLKLVQGAADFDDVEFIAQRITGKSVLYAFNQPECDWWRAPADNWIDHGGIACVLASSWISLVAPGSDGMLWNKRKFSTNALVAFNVEENSEWYGWDRYPNHTHFPFDNIEAVLANETDRTVNYRLIVNAERHTATVLYRNGMEVARVRQDRAFPMIFVGSHMPFQPRTNRISLVNHNGQLRGLVNGRQVIAFNDPQPLDVSKVGVGGHNTRINFSHIEIKDLDAAPQLSAPAPKKNGS